MKLSKLTAVIATAALAVVWSSDAVFAQGHGGGQARKHGQEHRKHETENAIEKQNRSMKTNRVREKVRKEIDDRDVYGRQMMSIEERNEYRKRLNAASSDKEWAQIREAHQNEMRARAQAQGREIEPPVYGEHMISVEERNRYTTRMQSAASDAEREQIRNEHREMIRSRAREMGVDIPPVG